MKYSVGIYVYDQVEVLDFAGPFEVFSTTLHESNENSFEVSLISKEKGIIKAFNGFKVVTDYDFQDEKTFDILIIPGGDESREVKDPEVIEYIIKQSSNTKIVASVCTGAFILAKAGLLKGKEVTTHHADTKRLQAEHPDLEVIEDIRFVDQKNIMTSAGISAGIDMSLYIVASLIGEDTARRTAKRMEYDYNQSLSEI